MATINVNVGVGNTYIVLYDHTNNTSTQVLTNSSGSYSFTTLPAGKYSVYNTGIDTTGQNPPTQCGFPPTYTGTTYPRRLDFTLGATTTSTATFNYDRPVPWSNAYGGNPPPIGLTTGGGINLATGAAVAIPSIGNNGFGYSIKDNMIYGNIQFRTDGAGSTVNLNEFATLPITNLGDIDFNGILYSPTVSGTSNNVTAICVDPYNPLYLRPVKMWTGGVMQEFITAPYYNVLNKNYTTLADWAYIPNQEALVWADSNELWFVSLTTNIVTTIPLIGNIQGGQYGINFADMKHLYYISVSGGDVIKVTITPTVGIASVLSAAGYDSIGDGARAANMPVNYALPNIRKRVDRTLGTDGDLLTYTVTIGNLGVTPGLVNFFYDTIPAETTFINGSVALNGISLPSANLSSINIGSLPVKSVQTITFQVKCSPTLPISEAKNSGNVITTYYDSVTNSDYTFDYRSNTVTTTIINNYLEINKSLDKTFSKLNDTITYTIVVRNPTTTTAFSTRFIDTIPIGSTFVSNSFVVNSVPRPTFTFTPPNGYLLGTITAGQINTITFKVLVVSVPPNNLVENISGLNYVYRLTTSNTLPITAYSNTVNTSLNFVDLSGIAKSVDKTYAALNSTIAYTIVIPNTGNTPAFDCYLLDTLANSLIYESNSLLVNGVPTGGTPNNIYIGTIPAGGVATITYIAKII